MALRLVYLAVTQIFAWLVLLARPQASKDAEILVLRWQLSVLARTAKPPAPAPSWAERALVTALARLLPKQRRLGLLVTLRTLLRWQTTGHDVRGLDLVPTPRTLLRWQTTAGASAHPRRARRPSCRSTI